MSNQLILQIMIDLLEKHQVPTQVQDEWIIPHGQLPAIRVNWFNHGNSGRLDIDVLLEDKRMITESFAGVGEGEKGIEDAVRNFCMNSLHVFLAAFWQKNDLAQVTIEKWKIEKINYTAYIGNVGQRSNLNVSPKLPERLFASIEHAILQQKPTHDLTWYRVFFCDVKGEQTFEALAENQEWQHGLEALKQLSWESSSGYYSVRNFIILKREKNCSWTRIINYFKN